MRAPGLEQNTRVQVPAPLPGWSAPLHSLLLSLGLGVAGEMQRFSTDYSERRDVKGGLRKVQATLQLVRAAALAVRAERAKDQSQSTSSPFTPFPPRAGAEAAPLGPALAETSRLCLPYLQPPGQRAPPAGP